MAVTDSRTAEALRPTSSDNETGLMDPLRQWISELIGLRLDLVRASWRPKPVPSRRLKPTGAPWRSKVSIPRLPISTGEKVIRRCHYQEIRPPWCMRIMSSC